MKRLSLLSLLVFSGAVISAPNAARAEDALEAFSNDTFFATDSLVSNEELDGVRGMSGSNFTAENLGVAVLNGIAVNNVTNGGVTGNNTISENAFNATQGVSFVVQNSGNNAVINAALVINLSLK